MECFFEAITQYIWEKLTFYKWVVAWWELAFGIFGGKESDERIV